MSYPIFAIFRIGGPVQIGRIRAAHNLHCDKILKGPFSCFESAQAALVDLQAEVRHAA